MKRDEMRTWVQREQFPYRGTVALSALCKVIAARADEAGITPEQLAGEVGAPVATITGVWNHNVHSLGILLECCDVVGLDIVVRPAGEGGPVVVDLLAFPD